MIKTTDLKKVSHLLCTGDFGLEKENVRVDMNGHLALTPHPAIFGDKHSNTYITTDFSESQIEMITPPQSSIVEMYNYAQTIDNIVQNEIGEQEMLWPQSLPPLLPNEEDIPIAKYSDSNKDKEEYRETLAKIYGKQRQLICGIHFNISQTDEFFQELSKITGKDIPSLKEETYLKITRNMMRNRWLMIWMYGFSPVAESNFKVLSLTDQQEVSMQCCCCIALRTSPLGYRNKENYTIDYSSIEAYHKSVKTLVDNKDISHSKELYLPLRMKFLSKDNGKPSYIEMRFIDLDPLTPVGVDLDNIYATHILYIYSLLKEETSIFGKEEQDLATDMQDKAACYGRCKNANIAGKTLDEQAYELVQDIKATFAQHELLENKTYADVIEKMERLTLNPRERKGVKIYENCKEQGFINYHLALAKEYKENAKNSGYRFFGKEDMEMSTQLLMRAAITKGLEIEVLDRTDNFIRLKNEEKEELVVQATKTSIDTYTTVLAMENKVVTKKILSEKNITVPKGKEYTDKDNATKDFEKYKGKAIVVKPKSTNFGIGITILKENLSEEDFAQAINLAFAHDRVVMIEEFIQGKEYRIFVINNKVAGILHRVPANVIGDGKHTIEQLVEMKNQDPRRGKGYKTPLEKIMLGEEEKLFLKLQGESTDSVIEEGKTVFLRENSNISTGGDSLDYTDDVHPSYKAIAEEAAKALGAKITGVDMMISSISTPATPENYAIIEVNFNPAIHIHCFPYKGKNRKLNFEILKALGF